MKQIARGDRVILTDAKGLVLGAADIDTIEGSRLLGTFHPAPQFERVSELFQQFEEHVEGAALAVLPAIEEQITALGLRIHREGEVSVPVEGVQIYSDGGFSCRSAALAAEPTMQS